LSGTKTGPLQKTALFILLSVSLLSARAQDTTGLPVPDKRKLHLLLAGGATAYTATLVGLHQLWYKEQPRSSFRFFNDNAEWKQVDKAGHLYTAYHISRLGMQAFRWAGMPPRKAALLGGVTGLLFQTPIEIMDGFSAAYGASWGDMAANAGGSVLFVGQHLLWQEERIHPKFSFYPSQLAPLRPNMLGGNLPQQALKDYNGQTYWLAFDIKPWLRNESRFPAWLNLSLGYGAGQMVYAGDAINQQQGYDAYRQYFLSLDVNFTRIQTRSRLLKSLFFLLNIVHIPAPALELNRKEGIRLHPVYF
jgi:uncharacterized protein YfiM (DUF2279 family)